MADGHAPETPVIDFGAHLDASEQFVRMGEERARLNDQLGEKHHDPDRLLEWLEAGGIDGAALSQPYFIGHGDAEATADSNDDLLDVVDAYDTFYGLAALPVAAGGEAAAAELERCLEGGFHGGAVESMSGGIQLVDRAFEPVLEAADRTGAPLFVHPKLDDSLGTGAFDDSYRHNAIYGREFAQIDSISKVVHEGVLDRYPDLNLVYHHMGGNIASMLGRARLQLLGRWPGRPDERELKRYPEFKYQLQDRIYVDTSGFFGAHAPLRATLEAFPTDKVLFGTDAPYEPRTPEELGELVGVVEQFTAESDAARILGGNALDVLVNVD